MSNTENPSDDQSKVLLVSDLARDDISTSTPIQTGFETVKIPMKTDEANQDKMRNKSNGPAEIYNND